MTDETLVGNDLPSIVTLELTSIPENLTLVRGMLGGVAELLAMDAELLDDVKTAISEAANNVVMHAYRGEPGPLKIQLYVSGDGLEAVVRDHGVGMPDETPVEDRLQGVGVPVMQALAQRAEFRPGDGGGTEVRMLFPAAREGRPLFGFPVMPAPEDGWTHKLSGDAVISLSPVTLLPSVLGRLARALAATARFSLDRFSDVYLVTDSISAHAVRGRHQQAGRLCPAGDAPAAPAHHRPVCHRVDRRADRRRVCPQLAPRAAQRRADHEPDGDGSELISVVMVDHRR